MPGFGWRWPLRFRHVPKNLKDQTIHIRVAGVDAPEGAYFGRPGQPHAEESLSWLRKRVEGKVIWCQLVRKDQYGRIVAVPVIPYRFIPLFLGRHWGSSLAVEMLRAGMVTTYEQSGAEYGPSNREEFLRWEAKARTARRGIWKYGMTGETPADYKKRHASSLSPADSSRKEGGS
ncbi:hypothetical protein ID866_8028 [Astraeus odoratus]|nr:hypothetical protein ID866_8028 [Astraeus odoratus]